METLFPPQPASNLSHYLYFQVVYTLTDLLPPPINDKPESLYARNRAAISKVAALMPVNANEVDLAAQCIAARAQAEDILRLIREHAGDVPLVTRLNAQYGSMVRTSLAVHGHLMRVQALRQKREGIEGAADQDARAQQLIERCMVVVEDVDAELREAESAKPAGAKSPEQTPAKDPEQTPAKDPEPTQPASPERTQAQEPEATPASTEQTIEQNAPENETDSQDTGFETWLSEQSWNQGSTGPADTELRLLQQSIALGRLADPKSPANSKATPASTDYHPQGKTEIAST